MSRTSVMSRCSIRALWVLGVILALGYGVGASADTSMPVATPEPAPASVSLAESSVFVETPVDQSGKKIEAEVLNSLHDELVSVLAAAVGKNKMVAAKADARVLVQVDVTDFHMRNQASRWMLGSMSGKDYITSKVTLVNAATNATLFTTEVKTSTANQYKGQDSIARMHADEIGKALAVAK